MSNNTLSFVTYNTLGTPFFAPDITKRYWQIAREINDGPYDIVCLQELFSYYHLFFFRNNLSHFPYIAYKKNLFGPAGGLAIFSKKPLKEKHFFPYSYPVGAHIPFYTKLAQNGILSATVKDTSLRICTTHLSSDIIHDLSPKNKLYKLIRSQSEEAAIVLNQYAKTYKSVVLAGDFNIAKNSQLYKSFLNATHAQAVFEKEEKPTYFPDRIPYFYVADQAGRIDHVFFKTAENIQIVEKNHLFNEQKILLGKKKSYLSDHIGLHCVFKM